MKTRELSEEQVARYGFRFGPVDVVRAIEDKKLGYFIDIETAGGLRAEIRVSPKGNRLRLLLKDVKIKDGSNKGITRDLWIEVPER